MNQKSQTQSNSANPYEELAAADCHHWKALMARIHEPVIAQLLVDFLDAEPDIRAKRSGVYLAAHATLDLHDQMRQAIQERDDKVYAFGRNVGAVVNLSFKVLRWGVALLRLALKASATAISGVQDGRSFQRSSDLNEVNQTEHKSAGESSEKRRNVVSKGTAGTQNQYQRFESSAQTKVVSGQSAQPSAKILQWPQIVFPEEVIANDVAIH